MSEKNFQDEVAKNLKGTLQSAISGGDPVTKEMIERVYPAAVHAVSLLNGHDEEKIEASIDRVAICNWVETQFNIRQE